MGSFDDFIKAVLDGAGDLAKQIFDGFETEAVDDAKVFLEKTEADLKRWTTLLANQDITERDFFDLVKAKKALAMMHGLTQAGISAIKLDRFWSGLVHLVIDSAFKIFL